MNHILKSNKKQILKRWLQDLIADQEIDTDLVNHVDLESRTEEILDELIKIDIEEGSEKISSDKLPGILAVLKQTASNWADQGLSPKESGLFILKLRNVLIEVLGNVVKDAQDLITKTKLVNWLIDELCVTSFEFYLEKREQIIDKQNEEIAEISTPVMRVWEGVLALPIIGTLDSERTQHVMEVLLEEITATESPIAILDISGVPTVDTLIAQHLIKTVNACKLMGTECVISGIRPDTAQTIVQLGIRLENITTVSTMADAIKYGLRKIAG